MAQSKLERDLEIFSAMSAEMGDYLNSDVLFWPMITGGMPQLTLGGALMRQFRLLALAHTLEPAGQQQLNQAVSLFNQALVERVVRFEQKANKEIEARIRQWGEYLRDLGRERNASRAGYNTAVETRLMLAAIVEKLQKRPYQLHPRIMPRIDLLDGNLRRFWEPGQFVLAEELQPAYPQADFWWLYGLPG
ncbi:MAG: hypothetical protein KC421_21725 [Anaerolineales bacterium]|nr:hypothetical protein [Anaerolineales bacterium]